MAFPDRRWEETFKPEQRPEAGAEANGAGEQDDGRPDFSKPYRAFGHPRTHALRLMFIYFNAAERRKYGKSKIQIQYEHLDSDDPASEGFAEDGKSFSIVVCGARKMLRITARGRQLEEGYDCITFHRMAWIRSCDRDFRKSDGEGDGPVITSIDIEPVEEGAAANAGAGQRVVDMVAE